jgi:hypothetical protein
MLPYLFGGFNQLQFSVNRNVYSFCFNDFTQNLTKNADVNYIGPLYWGNCFGLERTRIITGIANPRLCPLQLNGLTQNVSGSFPVLQISARTITQTTKLVLPSIGITRGPVSIALLRNQGLFIYRFAKNNNNFTNWDFNVPCNITIADSTAITISALPNINSIDYSTTSVPVFGSSTTFAAAIGSVMSMDIQDFNTYIVAWNIVDPTLSKNTRIGVTFLLIRDNAPLNLLTGLTNITFDPFPGNYTHGVHVFNPTVRVLANKSGFVMSYQQSTQNPNLSIPSTSYAYVLNSDPSMTLRLAEYPLLMNNLANPQKLTVINMTNPVNTGLAIPPNQLGFSIFGPGDANFIVTGISWSFINQNFQIMGERWTRTFTLSDQCGNTSCVQEIYLNNTFYQP